MAAGHSGISNIIPKYVQRRVRHSLIYLLIFLTLATCGLALYKGSLHLVQLKPENITIRELPSALTLSVLRMTASYIASLLLSFILGLLAARTLLGEKLILPFLDIMQSIPVVGFFPAAISFFIGITNGNRVGVEMAACFLILTSQAWNMAFAVYEAAKTIPQDNLDAIASLGVRGSQKFWKLYAPASVPRLVYNSILSWSNGWFFLVACEIFAVGPIRYHLPGIGSFLARAAEEDQISLVLWGLAALTTLILAMDFLIWRPASIWAERFRQDYGAGGETSTTGYGWGIQLRWLHQLSDGIALVRTPTLRLLRGLAYPLIWIMREILLPLVWDLPAAILTALYQFIYARFALPALQRWNRWVAHAQWINSVVSWSLGLLAGAWTAYILFHWLKPPWPSIAREIPMALVWSTLRLVITLTLSLVWILPVVYWSWNRPRLRQTLTTIAQIGASLPATALFPLIVIVAARKIGGGMEVATILLLLNGMQWYILFNALGGAAIIPSDLSEATRGIGLSGRLTWKRLVFPAIRAPLITGMITAWGGGWNALVVSEYVAYKDKVLFVNGIGSLLNRAVYQLGDNRAITLCIAALVGWILLFNSVLWKPLYQSAAERYKFD